MYKSKQIPLMEGEAVSKWKIDLYHLKPEAEKRIKELLNTEKFRTGRIITEKGTEVLEITKEDGKVLVELYDRDYRLHDYLRTKAPAEKSVRMMKTVQESEILDYDNGPVYMESETTSPEYAEIACAVRKMKKRIRYKMFEVREKVKNI